MPDGQKRPARRRRTRPRTALERVREADFPVVLRGYDRAAVDRYVAEIAQIVAELEATQSRETVVQRALDEIGEQTSGILQRAHETAEEIIARSRSQAEGRIQRAEREAVEARRDADQYAEQIVTETRRLWEDRQRLIEDMRQLAEELLSVSDDALDRVRDPRGEDTEDTTVEAAGGPGEGNGSGDLDQGAAEPGTDEPLARPATDETTAEYPGPAPQRGD